MTDRNRHTRDGEGLGVMPIVAYLADFFFFREPIKRLTIYSYECMMIALAFKFEQSRNLLCGEKVSQEEKFCFILRQILRPWRLQRCGLFIGVAWQPLQLVMLINFCLRHLRHFHAFRRCPASVSYQRATLSPSGSGGILLHTLNWTKCFLNNKLSSTHQTIMQTGVSQPCLLFSSSLFCLFWVSLFSAVFL